MINNALLYRELMGTVNNQLYITLQIQNQVK